VSQREQTTTGKEEVIADTRIYNKGDESWALWQLAAGCSRDRRLQAGESETSTGKASIGQGLGRLGTDSRILSVTPCPFRFTLLRVLLTLNTMSSFRKGAYLELFHSNKSTN
jgi:hypothetical protein